MKSMRTYIDKKRHKSGNATWIVRWKDPTFGRWNAVSGGKTENEALLVEAKIRQDLYRGEIPGVSDEVQKDYRVSELIDLFYQSTRYLNASPKWQKVIHSQFETTIRSALGTKYFSTLKKEQIFRMYMD